MSAHPTHASWPYRGPHLRPQWACIRHTQYRASLPHGEFHQKPSGGGHMRPPHPIQRLEAP
eukprot:660157-Pyramimonas_sp.AAC.1